MMHIERWKVAVIIAISLVALAFGAPNLVTREQAEQLPGWLPHKQISLGLDLQGGSHLLLEVDTQAIIRERLENLLDAARNAMRQARINYTGLAVQGNGIAFRFRDASADQVRGLARTLDTTAQVSLTADGLVTVKLDDTEVAAQKRRAVAQSIEIVRRRIDETGAREPSIQMQGEDRIVVQLPGITDPERVKRLLGKTAKMTFHFLHPTATPEDARTGQLPAGTQVLPADKELDPSGRPFLYVFNRRIVVSGDKLTDSQPSFDGNQGQWVVNFRFDTTGGRQFGNATKESVGQRLAIVLDGRVISAPVVREPILGGNGQISGSFNAESASELAILLRAGALPAPLTVIEERTVGPDLGADSIRAGTMASIIGLVLVAAFMLVTYGIFGVMANISLLVNLGMLIGALSLLQATLTLPGIAGIVLTMGMAVDANVLIYERVREEIRNGRTALSAIDSGFERAMATIIDTHLTTLISGVLMFLLGTGPIKGFAVTLSLGIITSLFTAVWVTRLQVAWWYRWRRPQVVPI